MASKLGPESVDVENEYMRPLVSDEVIPQYSAGPRTVTFCNFFFQIFEKIRLKTLLDREIRPDGYVFSKDKT